MFNIQEMMARVQEMQAGMERVKARLNDITVEAEAGDGQVRVFANGNKAILRIELSPEALKDKELLEDLLGAAVNKALDKAEDKARVEMEKATSGMLPPGMDLGRLGLGF